MSDRDINWGTHTIPEYAYDEEARVKANSFWTSGKPRLLDDPGFKARRAEKARRHEQNRSERAERNRSGGRR